MRKQNEIIYNKIMQNISSQIRNILNEDVNDFDIIDYQEDDDNLVSYDETKQALIKKPKNIMEEKAILFNIKPSEESINIANKFIMDIEKIIADLKRIQINVKEYSGDFGIFGYFSLPSNYSNDFAFFGFDILFFNFYYNPYTDDYIFKNFNEEWLAKILTFNELYNNPIQFTFSNNNPLFNEFKWSISNSRDVKVDEKLSYLYVTGNSQEQLLKNIQFVCQEFLYFSQDYLYTLHEENIDSQFDDDIDYN